MTQSAFLERNPGLVKLFDTLKGPSDEILVIWQQALTEKYIEKAAVLAPDHQWKTEMHEISRRMQKGILSSTGLGLRPAQLTLLGLLVYTHGLGRLVQAAREVEKDLTPPPTWGHGYDAMMAFEPLTMMAGGPDHPFWRAALYAIEHRPDASTPDKNTYADAEYRDGAHALLGILRDAIKRDGLLPERVGKNLNDAVTKRNVREATWPAKIREANPIVGTEQGRIVPESQLQRFKDHKALVRSECVSYEALMLQILAYLFDVMHPEFASAIIQDGGPTLVYNYLKDRIPSDEMAVIDASLVRWNAPFAARICKA